MTPGLRHVGHAACSKLLLVWKLLLVYKLLLVCKGSQMSYI